DNRVSDQRRGQQQAGLRLAQSETDQVEHQDDRNRAICEKPNEPGREQQPGNSSQLAKVAGQQWVSSVGHVYRMKPQTRRSCNGPEIQASRSLGDGSNAIIAIGGLSSQPAPKRTRARLPGG